MRKLKRASAAFLAAVLIGMLAACGGPAEEPSGGTAVQTQPSGTPEETSSASAPEPGTPAETETPSEPAPPKTVSSPMSERPYYGLEAGASAQEMRETAVRAMRDELSILWYPARTVTYRKTGAGEGKDFVYTPDEIYAGMAYTNGTSGIFQWLEYYDPETGCLDGPGGEPFNSRLGNSCAACVMWGWSSCVSSITWRYTHDMVQKKGFLRVGPYTYPDDLASLKDLATSEICENNGREVMYASYAAVRAADGLVTYTSAGSHGIMASQDAHVEYEGGVIDGEKSYLIIQEQRSGIFQTSAEYVKTENGERHHYSGRIDVRFTFKYLFDHSYIPGTCAEFLGEQPYVTPQVTLKGDVRTLEDLAGARVESPYKICVLYADITNEKGEAAAAKKYVAVNSDISITTPGLQSVPLSRLNLTRALLFELPGGKTYTIRISALDATGTLHEVLSFQIDL